MEFVLQSYTPERHLCWRTRHDFASDDVPLCSNSGLDNRLWGAGWRFWLWLELYLKADLTRVTSYYFLARTYTRCHLGISLPGIWDKIWEVSPWHILVYLSLISDPRTKVGFKKVVQLRQHEATNNLLCKDNRSSLHLLHVLTRLVQVDTVFLHTLHHISLWLALHWQTWELFRICLHPRTCLHKSRSLSADFLPTSLQSYIPFHLEFGSSIPRQNIFVWCAGRKMYFEAGGAFCVKKMYQPCGSLTVVKLERKGVHGRTELHHGLRIPWGNTNLSPTLFSTRSFYIAGMAVRSVSFLAKPAGMVIPTVSKIMIQTICEPSSSVKLWNIGCQYVFIFFELRDFQMWNVELLFNSNSDMEMLPERLWDRKSVV